MAVCFFNSINYLPATQRSKFTEIEEDIGDVHVAKVDSRDRPVKSAVIEGSVQGVHAMSMIAAAVQNWIHCLL